MAKKKNLGGRPTKFRQDRADAIVAYLTAGSFLTVAAARVGISTKTLDAWRTEGARCLDKLDEGKRVTKEERAFAEFARRCAAAESEWILSQVKILATESDPKTRLELLARRHPKLFAPKTSIDHTSSDKSMTPAAVGVVVLPALTEDGTSSTEDAEPDTERPVRSARSEDDEF